MLTESGGLSQEKKPARQSIQYMHELAHLTGSTQSLGPRKKNLGKEI
jgi:hypothetical protein